MKRRSTAVAALLVAAVGASILAAVMLTGSVSAAPSPPQAKIAYTTIYSDTFMPYKRFGDDESEQLYRFEGGPGAPPNTFSYRGGVGGTTGTSGFDAFFNTPDLTIGSTPMSAVSAQVCFQLVTNGGADVQVIFGVQDKDGKVTSTPLDWTTSDSQQQCHTLTLTKPVTLTNHPHMVVALVMTLNTGDSVYVDGVTYTLQPTQKGDVTPGS